MCIKMKHYANKCDNILKESILSVVFNFVRFAPFGFLPGESVNSIPTTFPSSVVVAFIFVFPTTEKIFEAGVEFILPMVCKLVEVVIHT